MAELYDIGETHEFAFGSVTFLSVTQTAGDDYDPKITTEIDTKIRNLPRVVKYTHDMARLLRARAGVGFDTLQSDRAKTRARVYVWPNTSQGIKRELQEGALLKAALGMRGK